MAIPMTPPSEKPITFDDKLAAMLCDLISIAERMNKDGQPDVATEAQNCINAVFALRTNNASQFTEFDWKWEPEELL